jgi:uncharacterized membrane protein
METRNIQRRAAAVEEARQVRGLQSRDAASVLSTSHNETDLGFTVDTPSSMLFAANNSCVLTPEVTQGPYCRFCPLSINQNLEQILTATGRRVGREHSAECG